jgi:hypothetical protein
VARSPKLVPPCFLAQAPEGLKKAAEDAAKEAAKALDPAAAEEKPKTKLGGLFSRLKSKKVRGAPCLGG